MESFYKCGNEFEWEDFSFALCIAIHKLQNNSKRSSIGSSPWSTWCFSVFVPFVPSSRSLSNLHASSCEIEWKFFPTIGLGYGHFKIQKFAERKDFSRTKLIPLTNFYFDSFDQGLVESSLYIEETSMKAQHLLAVHQIPGSRKLPKNVINVLLFL